MVIRDIAAYSRLTQLLRDRGWTVAELLRRLHDEGVRVDRKTIYRLAGPAPVGRTDISLIRRICDILGVGLDDFFRFAEPLPSGEPNELWDLSAERVQRLNDLGQRNNEGSLNDEERSELADLVAEYEAVVLHNAKVRLWRVDPGRFESAQAKASNL
ncbi:MAG TPA: helix-turn-helix transcriptional regulator [Chloroflexota bacterium]|nr:helix-turn-helix transcriptional regulator [Chloroflexota bacterium]